MPKQTQVSENMVSALEAIADAAAKLDRSKSVLDRGFDLLRDEVGSLTEELSRVREESRKELEAVKRESEKTIKALSRRVSELDTLVATVKGHLVSPVSRKLTKGELTGEDD
jgi:transposase-like protein